MVTVRPFVAERDAGAVFVLWQAALGVAWPLTTAQFRRVTDDTSPAHGRAHFVAEDEAAVVGFAATQVPPHDPGMPPEGHLPALLVAPSARRRGIGTALHDRALAHLRERGVRRVQMGGGIPRIWPGVPTNLPAALSFFHRQGWAFAETSHDLVRDVRDEWPTMPPPRLGGGIAITVGATEDVPELLTFERREFPS